MLVTVAVITTVAAVIISIVPGGYKNISSMMSSAQTPNVESSPQVVGSHTPGYPITTTSGNILDPLQTSVDGNPANAVVDRISENLAMEQYRNSQTEKHSESLP
jgi:hypothetical protein